MSTLQHVDIIQARLKQAFHPNHLEVIDESDKHIGHPGHQGGGRHFAVVITAACFNAISRVEAHRQIYALFNDMIPEQIHALRIKIS
jgi:BolA family transcriptional regulator, general stress-responsive regulator